ncbi:hypothetical protein INS49_011715 [Diaporthe citri]|uniref:uncharacterized protein n=1 Tax=Diaporthe citri TaxID=83186 RepID=UPI001C823EE6|nr:uncharacterized protein INS49_011715 [Diaporthe citri]KAG6360650.1 hypothetical protein INS49_011715 [Diaporthe citri]
MSDPIDSPETPKKGQLNEKQTKLLAAMTQNTIGKVEYNWEKIAIDTGYKNVASAKSTYSRLCSQLNGGGSKSSTDKGDTPVSGGPKTPTKVSKRTGKVGSSSTKKPRGKKGAAAAAAAAAADAGKDGSQKEEQIEVKGEPEDEDEVDAMMSGAL